MRVTTEEKEKLFKKFGKDSKDSGSVHSQAALFSESIKHLTAHLKEKIKDYSTQRSLQLIVGRRRKLLDYLKSKDILAYRELIKDLKLRK